MPPRHTCGIPLLCLIFLSGTTVEDNETSFSCNYISLEISGQELEDLSFVDLLGLIASVGEHGRVDNIKLVRNLVISYIERESCVILLTVTCESLSILLIV